jgi:hypothetical protein
VRCGHCARCADYGGNGRRHTDEREKEGGRNTPATPGGCGAIRVRFATIHAGEVIDRESRLQLWMQPGNPETI